MAKLTLERPGPSSYARIAAGEMPPGDEDWVAAAIALGFRVRVRVSPNPNPNPHPNPSPSPDFNPNLNPNPKQARWSSSTRSVCPTRCSHYSLWLLTMATYYDYLLWLLTMAT